MRRISPSRRASYATSNRTLVESDTKSPFGSWDGIASPIIQTPDQKQWIDLELLNPKFLKGLSQYAQREESNGKLGKSAAKVKAWARQSKAGIDFRLRRKIDSEKDEITDIRLVPDAYTPTPLGGTETSSTQELPAMDAIAELANTGMVGLFELDSSRHAQPSRSSTSSTLGEPLPRYEQEINDSPSNVVYTLSESSDRDELLPPSAATTQAATIRHQPYLSQSSVVPPLTRGVSLRDAASPESTCKAKDESEDTTALLKADLDDVSNKLEEQRQLSESLQVIVQALREEERYRQNHTHDSTTPPRNGEERRRRYNGLTVAQHTTYETETELQPPLPWDRSSQPKKSARNRRGNSQNPTQSGRKTADVPSSESSDAESDAAPESLMRRQTLPKRLPTSAGINALWRSVLHMGTILLGPDHEFVNEARFAFRARKMQSGNSSPDLTALTQIQVNATRAFGARHPWVAALTEDLARLTDLIKKEPLPSGDKPSVRTEASAEDAAVMPEHSRTVESPDVRPPQSVDAAVVTTDRSLHQIDTAVHGQTPSKEPSPVVGGVEIDSQLDLMWSSRRLPHQPRSNHLTFAKLSFAAVSRITWNGIQWLQENYGTEQPVPQGKTRVRWTCSCGERLHDDFIERRPGAARALEAYLNRPRGVTLGRAPSSHAQGSHHQMSSPTTAGSSPAHQSWGSSFGPPPSSHTSLSGNSFLQGGSWSTGDDKMQQIWSGMPSQLPFSPTYEPPWLLTCATEDRFTPKVTHLDMSRHKIRSDKDLANSLREHYFHLQNRWWKTLRLRGLTTIEFVQFEVHQNRFADIRKVPDVPLKGRPDYNFEPSDLLPPVGSHYLLHLFKHPEDYDGELITYLRAPKKNGRLQLGVGWGINLVEGFLADKVWIWMSAMFATGSLIFGVVYAVKKHDVQGAFGVAAWIVTLGALAAGWLQACLG